MPADLSEMFLFSLPNHTQIWGSKTNNILLWKIPNHRRRPTHLVCPVAIRHLDDQILESGPTDCSLQPTSGSRGPGHPCPQDLFKIMQSPDNCKGKPLF